MRSSLRYLVFGLGWVGLFGLGGASELGAYQLQTSSYGKTCRWFDSSLPLPWWMSMNGFTRVSAADAEATFKTAMEQWTSQSCTRWRATFQGVTTTKKANDGKVVLLFDYPPGSGFSTLAITYTTLTPSTGEYNDADIIFHHSRPWSANPTSQENDLRATATHEIGHLLGLAHSSDPNSTMYATVAIGPSQKRFLGQDDINGLCALYPATTPTTSGDLGALCGTSAQGATCKAGLVCVSGGSGKPAYCHELCQQGICPNGGKCLQTSQGTFFCGCDSSADCGSQGICIARICRGGSAGCSQDSDCPSSQICSQGTCVIPPRPECTQDSDCSAGLRCLDSSCVECKTHADCPSGRFCASSVCVICRTDSDCLPTHVCSQARCIDKPTGPQAGGRGSLCGSSAGGASCDPNLVCVNLAGQPAYCMEFCQNGACPLGGNCYKTTAGTRFCACDADSECPADHRCIQRNCFPQKPACSKDADCPTAQRCNNGLCEDRPGKGFGEICSSDADCISLLCLTDASAAKRYCSISCPPADPTSCPAGTLCRSLGASGACFVTAFPTCRIDADCPPSTSCLQNECRPRNPESLPETLPEAPSETLLETPPETPLETAPMEATADGSPESPKTSEERYRPSGCGCSQSSMPGTFGLWLLGLLLVFLGRRPPPF